MKNIEMHIENFNLKYEEFIIGCDAVEEMGLWDKDEHGEMEAFYANDMIGVIIKLIAKDGKVTSKEVDYLNETFGFEYTIDSLVELYKNSVEDINRSYNENLSSGMDILEGINPELAKAYKELLMLCCEIIAMSDGSVSESEINEIIKLENLLD